MGHFSLRFLGSPEVHVNNRLVAFPTRKALALLVFLAVEQAAQVREKITALLWPESSSAQGRASLRNTLVYLREALGEAAAHLIAEHDTLRFDLTEVDFDLQRLQTAARLTRRMSSTPIRDGLSQLQAAADGLQGEFLEGFSLRDAPEFDTWAATQREAWHRQATLVYEWLALLQSEAGQLPQALDTAARWVAHDPLNESAHRRLMQMHFAVGDRAAALETYDACRALLKRELNAEASPETAALAQRIRTQLAPAREVAVERIEKRIRAYDAPLIGRATEHSELVAAYWAARKGQAQLASIEGEPGIGKTRLAREFLSWAAAQGGQILAGRSFEMGHQLPYQPIIDALRQANLETALPRLSPIWLAELTRLMPELSELYPALPAPLPLAETEARSRLFEAIARLGQALAGTSPLVLFIDDLQWTDGASLDLLAYVARRWAATETLVLILLTVRSEDLTPLTEWLTSLGRDLKLTRLNLASLTEADTLALLASLEAGDWTYRIEDGDRQSLIRSLYTETGGQPLFIIETLKSWHEQGSLHGAPPGVQEVIRRRLARLSATAHQLCSGAAVFGGQFEFGPLCRLTEIRENDALPALEEMLARGLLKETGAGQLYFSHDKIREVAYNQLSETRRQVLHRRALEVLTAEAAPPGELARHALAGGLPERAWRLLIAAGEEALRVFAGHNAITLFEQARGLLNDVQPPMEEQLVLYLNMGQAYELIGRWDWGRSAYGAALALSRESHKPASESEALAALARVTSDYRQFLFTAIAAGTEPDIFYIDICWWQEFVKIGAILPLDDKMAASGVKKEVFIPSLIDSFTRNGQVYGIPKDYNSLGLYYNKDLFDRAGLRYPTADWTWDDLKAAAEKLSDPARNIYGLGVPADAARFPIFVFQNGGAIMTPDLKDTLLDSDNVVEAAKFYTGFRANQSGAMPSDVGEAWQGTAFGKGRFAMVFEGGWLISHLRDQFPNTHYGTVVPPKGPAGVGNLIFCVACAMSKNAKNPDAAWTLINFLTNEENQKAELESGICLPSRVSLKDSDGFKKNPNSAVFLAGASQGARLYFWGAVGSVVNDEIQKALEDIMQHNQEPADSFRAAAAKVRDSLASL